ncbi:hypothetical protein KSP39_PZI009272 [Platanthera zijinensis]|uniref:Uncharacterized protein n=1 Tax=Platanthera zijinensis TaxID=2320716 RepID=A0AAP0BKM2_9ASPA
MYKKPSEKKSGPSLPSSNYDLHDQLIVVQKFGKNNQLLSPHVEKHQFLPIDVAGNVNATGSPAEQLDQNSRGMIIGGDGKKIIQVLFDESSSKSMTAEGCQFNASQLTSLLFNSLETSNEPLPSKSDDTCANVKVDDSNSYSLSGENSSLCNAASPQTNSPKLINSVSEEIMVDTKAIPSLLISHGECRIPGNVHVDNSEKNSFELHLDYEEHSSDSTIDIDHVLNSCGEDEVEEVETEHVGYGSNCREAESFEAKSEFCSQSDLTVGTSECKPEGWILSTCDVNRFWAIEGSHGRSRVWVDPPHHHVNCRFDISDNYSSPKFPLPGSRNASAAAVANVKRNGFVNAPDGTVIVMEIFKVFNPFFVYKKGIIHR